MTDRITQPTDTDRIELSCSVCGDHQVLRPQRSAGVIG